MAVANWELALKDKNFVSSLLLENEDTWQTIRAEGTSDWELKTYSKLTDWTNDVVVDENWRLEVTQHAHPNNWFIHFHAAWTMSGKMFINIT